MIAVNATQCISCGHVSAPASQLYQCDACGSFDLHVFMAETDEIEVMLAPLPRSAEAKLLAALEAEERWTLTTLGEGACDTDF